jgi:YHS domain-containing protein
MSTTLLTRLLVAAALTLAAGPLSAQFQDRSPVSDDEAPAIEGYSPVSYFEVGRPQKGSPAYSSTYRGKEYWFTSAEQLARFEADPSAYAPVFPDHCPYSLSLGRAVAVDPTNFKIVGGNLLLFHDSAEMAGATETLDEGEVESMLQRARANLLRMRF